MQHRIPEIKASRHKKIKLIDMTKTAQNSEINEEKMIMYPILDQTTQKPLSINSMTQETKQPLSNS